MAYLYRHIRLDTNLPFYIGIGKDQNYNRAYSKHNRNKYWNNIVNKTEYKVQILFEHDDYNFIKIKEKEFISLYGYSKNGLLCNMTEGGEGLCNPSEEVIQKLSQSKLGNKNPQYEKKWTVEKRQTMSSKMSGINNPNYGKVISKEQKEKIALAQKGRKKSEIEKEKIYSKTRKKIIDVNTGIIYNSINEAAFAFNVKNYTMYS